MWTNWIPSFLQTNTNFKKQKEQLERIELIMNQLSQVAGSPDSEARPKNTRLADKVYFLTCAREKVRLENEIRFPR